MLSLFPQFKKLEISDRVEIERITTQFLPYSDFNFTSLWAWDIAARTEVSLLGKDNLVIRMPHYISQETIYLFCGNSHVEKSLTELFEWMKKEGIPPQVSLVPEVTIAALDKSDFFSIEEDAGNHDYILSAKDIVEMKGPKWRAKKNFLNRFFREYGERFSLERLELENESTRQRVEETFHLWAASSGKELSYYENELRAFRRLFHGLILGELLPLGLFIDGALQGFALVEKIHKDYVIIHFEKANTTVTGIYTFLNHEVAKVALGLGCKYINYEQDLGIAGLEKAKKSYNPVNLFTKYIITPR